MVQYASIPNTRLALANRKDQRPSECLTYFYFKLLSQFLYTDSIQAQKK